MVAFTIAATSVRLRSGTGADQQRVTTVTAAEAIVPGQPVTQTGYVVDPTDADLSVIFGTALNYAAIGDTVILALSGIIAFSNTVSVGKTVYAADSGDWQYYDDIPSESSVIQIGYASTANSIILRQYDTGVDIP